MVGIFIFMDHGAPISLRPYLKKSMDVLPHPHIGLSISYLFSGELVHRDSLGEKQVICPGEVNWMTAGSGISHSKRFEDRLWESDSFDGTLSLHVKSVLNRLRLEARTNIAPSY